MSDFINHLFSRSFAFDSDPLSVHPRLPSLFETPLTEQQKFAVPFFTNPAQTNEEGEAAPESEYEAVIPTARFSPDFVATVRPNTNFSPTERNPQNGKRYSTPDLPESFQPLFKVDSFTTRESMAPSGNLLPENGRSFSLFPEQRMQSAETRNESDPATINVPVSGKQATQRISSQLVPKHVMIPSIGQQNPSDKDKTASLLPKRTPSLRLAADSTELKLPRLSAEIFDHQRETAAEPAEPVINVTIGRIEIRATPGSSAPARKSHTHKPSTMSLDDYLNKRNGGVR